MTIPGSGVGRDIGGPQVPLQNEIDASAWTQVNKQALGIVPNSIDQPFQQINPRYNWGYLGGFGYRTAAENPLLDHPLEVQRRAESESQSQGNTWKENYQELVNQLPPELLDRFNAESEKPFDNRALNFISLDYLFQITAKVLSQAESTSKPTSPESLEALRTDVNLSLPFGALKGAVSNSQEIVASSTQLLAQQGANNPYFDGLNNSLNQMQGPLNTLTKVTNALTGNEPGQVSPQIANASSKAAQQLATLGDQLEQVSTGPDLQLLLPTIRSLEAVATALSLDNTASASLFLGFYMASEGLFSSQSSLGLFDSGLETVSGNLNQWLTASLIPPDNKAGADLLSMATTLSLAIFTGIGTLTAQSGLGIYPNARDPRDIENARSFGLEIALQMAASSGLLKAFYNEAIAISGGGPDAQAQGSTVLSQFAIFLITLAASNDAKKTTQLIESQAINYSQALASADEIEKNNEDIKQEAIKEDRDKADNLAITIKLANLALESQDYEAFVDTLGKMFESLGTSQADLKKDLVKAGNAATNIVGVTSLGDPDKQITGIINVV